MSVIHAGDNGALLNIRLTPKAKKDQIGPIHDDRLKISVTSPPVEGKANKHLIRILSKKTGVAKSSIEIVSGETAREKTVLFRGAQCDDLKSGLGLS